MESATLTRPSPGTIRLERLRSLPGRTWERAALAAMTVAAFAGYLAYPTYPTYDSFYALLWGRDVLHLHLPDFSVYRAPTEHPLAIAFGALCSIFGQGGARLMVLGSILSFVALVAGSYRLGRACFGPVVGVIGALLVLSRFFVENLAAQGYLDISYLALLVWAVTVAVERPRQRLLVLVLLGAAGLLRPDAWVLGGAYALWCCWRVDAQDPRQRLRLRVGYLALAVLAPLVWASVDGVVTGNPLHSFGATAGLAAELERTQGFGAVLHSLWSYSIRIDKLPVVLGALIGLPVAVWLAPRRAVMPLAALLLLVFVYLAEGAVGASVVDRYLLGADTMALPFCAVALGGWAMLRPGAWLRRAWIVAAAGLFVYGVAVAATSLSLTNLRTALAYHNDFHTGLAAALAAPPVRAQMRRCPLVSLPDNKLIPDARWILDTVGQHNVVARSEARSDANKGARKLAERIRAGSVAVYPLGSAVFFTAIVDIGDDARDQVPLTGFRRIYTSRYYAVYANC